MPATFGWHGDLGRKGRGGTGQREKERELLHVQASLGRGWSVGQAIWLDPKPCPKPVKPICPARNCSSNFAGVDPNSSIGLAGAFPGLRGKCPLTLK